MGEAPTSRTPALLIFGDLFVAARQGRIFEETGKRGLAPVLVVSEDTDQARLARMRADTTGFLFHVADVVVVRGFDPDRVLPALQDVLLRFDVRGVLNIGEYFVESAGLLASCLGLPGPGVKASRVSRNKLLQRYAVPELSPRWRVVPPHHRADFPVESLGYPVVLKPTARNYSRGVRKVARHEELRDLFAGYPEDETLLVEEQAIGREFSVEAVIQGGRVLWTGVTGKQSNEQRTTYFTEMEHTSPAVVPAEQHEALVAANTHVVRRLEFGDGLSHAEFRLTERGPVLMEIAARRAGDEITLLWELATARAIEPVMVDLALGVPTEYPGPRRRTRHRYLSHPHGQLVDVASATTPVHWVVEDYRWPQVSSVEATAPARHCAVLVHRHRGEVLGEISDSTQRSASVIVDCPLDDDIDATAANFAAGITIKVAD